MTQSAQPVFWSPGVTLEAIEKQVILNAFRFYRGNKTQCSISLGISIRTLENKLEKYEDDGKQQLEAERKEQLDRDAILRRQRGIVGDGSGSQEGARLHGSYSGVHLQPTLEASEKPAVPVQEPAKVQSVLPAQPAARSAGRGR